ncbi:MAG: radical SAM family heme chaperone HemW, partial [Corallococcus sp.]|nr:radical SAM family heme chaperone HemW [Corallococcus sp.]
MKQVAIYIHIPFCRSRCSYCTFVSNCDFSLQKDYFDCLCREIETKCKGKTEQISSIYLGGGTPSAVDEKYIDMVFDTVYRYCRLSDDVEITAECNPESLSKSKADCFAQIGVNRFSIGLQSVNDGTLKKLGRAHNFAMFENALNNAIGAGVTNINTDLIIGLPESHDDFLRTANRVADMPIRHVSAYALEVYANSRMAEEIKKGKYTVPTDTDLLCDMYDEAMAVLGQKGFVRYEVSNFAQTGYESKHNSNYWQCGEYYGIGCGAHQYYEGNRSANFSDIAKYISAMRNIGSATESCQTIDKTAAEEEYLMLGLRMTKRVSQRRFKKIFGEELLDR